MKNNNISFIIPAYNCEKTIEESVDSIFNDNFEEGDEVVICDDCSTDNTYIILKKIFNKYQRKIRLVRHLRNKGGGAARNTAVENTKNELIFCLDSDNLLEMSSIGKLKSFLLKHKLDVASFSTLKYFIDDKSNITHFWDFHLRQYTLHDVFSDFKFPGASGNYLYTKEIWKKTKGYPEFAGALDAWGFGFLQVLNGAKMMCLPNSYYYHRHGNESYWVRDSKSGKISLSAFQLILPYLEMFSFWDRVYLFFNRKIWFEKLEARPLKVVNITNND